MHLSHLQEHLLNITMWSFICRLEIQTKISTLGISVLMRHWEGEVSGYYAVLIFFPFHTRLLLEFLLNTDCLPYLPYFLYSRSKAWLTLLLSDTVRSHLWTWAGCSNTREHRPRSNTVPLGSGALLKHQQPPNIKRHEQTHAHSHSVQGLQRGYACISESPEHFTCCAHKLITEMEVYLKKPSTSLWLAKMPGLSVFQGASIL